MLKNINIFWKENGRGICSALVSMVVVTAMYNIPYIAYFSKHGI